MTLDGGVAVTDGGYSAGDQSFQLVWDSDAVVDAAIVRLLKLYSRLVLSTMSGVFEVIPEKYRLGDNGKSTLSCLAVSQISA